MNPAWIVLALALVAGDDTPEPPHAANEIYRSLLADGMEFGGTKIPFPAPKLKDGQPADAQRLVLEELAGGARASQDLLRDSVTAPFVLKVRDEATKDGDPIRLAHLVFTVHADLAAIDPADAARQTDGKATEVANMKIATALLKPEALQALNIPQADPNRDWFAHLSARLLDRIQLESTDHVVVTRTDDSLVIASRTDPRFGFDGPSGNSWTPLSRDGKPSELAKPYEGGASYTKITRLTGAPGTLVVEARFAFVEPKPWFDGAPILRSKIAPIAQDQVRRLRRETRERGR